MAGFLLDLKGRINNTTLPESKYLWALLEAVVNSIQSIEDSNLTDGKIEIYGKRQDYPNLKLDVDNNTPSKEPKLEITAFESFVVTDNGNGFTSKNYKSFCTADSSLKWEKGCKGIGRFLWLKAFRSARINSVFEEDGEWYQREFIFNASGTEPDDNCIKIEKKEQCTTIELCDFRKAYRDKCPKSLEVLARKIIEHCLIYFIAGKCPLIVVRDNLGESIVLNSYYAQNIKDSLHQDRFELEGSQFVLYHLRIPEGATSHELHLCGNGREVRSLKLDKFYPNLQRKIASQSEKGFYYCGYLTSPYLDARVNTSRTGFDFADDDQVEFENPVIEKRLIDTTREYVSAYLKEYIDDIDTRKRKRVTDFVAKKQPQYRYLLNQRPEVLNSIKPELSDEELELALHRQVLEWDFEAKERGQDIKDKMSKSGIPTEEIMPRFQAYCKEVTAISRVSLSEYIIRRKVILDLLEEALQLQEDGTYANESRIHTIICPMKYTSDEISFEEMNLWLIDERLAYHNYLASDKQMRQIPVLESNSLNRMDIAVFDEALSFSDKENSFNAITIIEFKKPNRDDLDKHDSDPIWQVCNYVEEIKSGKAKRANGRPFGNVLNTAFYCYVIADLTDSLHRSAKMSGLNITPDGDGYFGYNQNYGTYIEVISYNKLIKDAQERNKVLFDKIFKPDVRKIIGETGEEIIDMIKNSVATPE